MAMAVIARLRMDMLADKRYELYQWAKKNPNPLQAIGFPKPQALVSAIGQSETILELNYRFESLEAFTAAWNRTQEREPRMWRRALAAFTVPGSARWEILRIKEDEEEG